MTTKINWQSNKWKDFPDYILGITREIWEERGIHTLHDYYSKDIIVRSPSGVVKGNEAVISATMATLAEFSDRVLLGEDVIWSGTPETGMLSSHRIFSTATHTGHGIYGAPTGKKLGYRIIADCHAINGQINDEWLIRDQGAIVRQMGFDPKQYAADMIEAEGGIAKASQPFNEKIDQPGPYKAHGNDNEWGKKYADLLNQIMGGAMAVIQSDYDRALHSEYPGGVTGHGREPADQFWMGLRSSLPNADFTIHHQIGRDDEMLPPRAAIRWSLSGKHEGWGTFGQPSGADIYVMGVSHAEFGPWGLRREYTLFDETAVWKQILLKTG
jgi:predicted ester cyclase